MIADGTAAFFKGSGFSFPITTHKGTPLDQLIKVVPYVDWKTDGPGTVSFLSTFAISVEDFPAGHSLSQFYEQSISFDVDAKSYAASDFAELLSTNFSNPNISGTVPTQEYILTDNPLIKTVRQLQNDPDFSEGNPQFFSLEGSRAAGGASSFEFTTAKTPADPDTTLNYVLGSSQFAVLYNNEYDKFEIGQIHNSLYSSVVTLALESTAATVVVTAPPVSLDK